MRRDRGREGKSNVSYSEGVMMNQRGVWYFEREVTKSSLGIQATQTVLLIYYSEKGLYISKKGNHTADEVHTYALSNVQ
jgi:hypothetical protein